MNINQTDNNDGTIDLQINCECGKPIVHSNEYGMFCEDNCYLEESIKTDAEIDEFIDEFLDRHGE